MNICNTDGKVQNIFYFYRVIPINIDFVFERTMPGFRFGYGYC